jgi:hypothetical protein
MGSSMSAQKSPTITQPPQAGSPTPLKAYEPFNIIVLLVFYSPIIISLGLLAMTFIFQNFKGFTAFIFLLIVASIREYVMFLVGGVPTAQDGTVCQSVLYSKYGNQGFNLFILAYIIIYICLPMFLNDDVNYWIFGILVTYYALTLIVMSMKNCFQGNTVQVVTINTIAGAAFGVAFVSMLYTSGNSKTLFFNEISSSKEICSMPKSQQFKCSVYKNGELIATT